MPLPTARTLRTLALMVIVSVLKLLVDVTILHPSATLVPFNEADSTKGAGLWWLSISDNSNRTKSNNGPRHRVTMMRNPVAAVTNDPVASSPGQYQEVVVVVEENSLPGRNSTTITSFHHPAVLTLEQKWSGNATLVGAQSESQPETPHDNNQNSIPALARLDLRDAATIRHFIPHDDKSYQRRHTSIAVSIPASDKDATAHSPYAYAFVIGGCDPDQPQYRGFYYNILVAAKLFQEVGSTADIVALFQIKYASNWTTLPDQELNALHAMNVRVMYIPKSSAESFYDTVLNKFRILSLTEYRRVILMDGDVMPNDNLDYLFLMSDGINATMKENLVVAGPFEPANAGFFMLSPGEGEWDHLQQIVQSREATARNNRMSSSKSLGYLPDDAISSSSRFDIHTGWGHVIEPPDEWVARKGRGTNWDFHFAFSDQGLLYHWTKYVKKSVSIVFQYDVENWSSMPNEEVYLESTLEKPFTNVSQVLTYQYAACKKFMCGFLHMVGKYKPWLKLPILNVQGMDRLKDYYSLWWSTLQHLDRELQLQIDFVNWDVGDHRPPLGFYAKSKELNKRVTSKRG